MMYRQPKFLFKLDDELLGCCYIRAQARYLHTTFAKTTAHFILYAIRLRRSYQHACYVLAFYLLRLR